MTGARSVVATLAVLVLSVSVGSALSGGSPSAVDESDAERAAPTATVSPPAGASSELTARSDGRGVARVCGSKSLRGPSRRPRGARTVRPGQDLAAMVDNASRGTTFWLRRGTHRLGNGRYSQVVPKSGMRFIGAPGAVLDGRRQNLYAFGGYARDVVIEHLTIQRFGGTLDNRDAGVVNHDAGNGWAIRHNTIRRNGGAGVFLGDRSVVARNCLRNNGQYGFSAYEPDGVRGIRISGNEIAGNNTANWEARIEFCGCTGGGKIWETRGARIVGNWVHDNRGVGLWADTNNTGVLIQGNVIEDNDAEGVIYETSYNAAILHNTFRRNGLVVGPKERGFPTPALYLSESGSDRRAGRRYGDRLRVMRNRFVDNWAGVIAWENADRFAGSPANTSTGVTTLVNPKVATERACSDPDLIGTDPYYDDCRWKTRLVRVARNVFVLRPSRVGPHCTAARQCGYTGVFSNYGSYPAWSPYKGTVVERAITFDQGNRWVRNRYRGPWRFMVLELGNRVSWRTWRSARYHQDAGSSLR